MTKDATGKLLLVREDASVLGLPMICLNARQLCVCAELSVHQADKSSTANQFINLSCHVKYRFMGCPDSKALGKQYNPFVNCRKEEQEKEG